MSLYNRYVKEENDCDELPRVTIRYKKRQQNKEQKDEMQNGVPELHTATSYDVDNEYSYIMDKALQSYRDHTVTVPAVVDFRPTSAVEYGHKYVLQLTPKKVYSLRTNGRSKMNLLPPKAIDAILEVGRANNVAERRGRCPSATRIILPMDKLKPKNYVNRRPWNYNSPKTAYDTGGLFEKLGKHLIKRPETPKHKEEDAMSKSMYEGGLFSEIRTPRKSFFTIHPDWVSENLTVEKLTLHERTCTFPPRRCRSAPPPRSRNPITWEMMGDRTF